jgi:hypothetical protein
MKKCDSEVLGSSALSHPGREKFAHFRVNGFKAAEAAKLCRISKNTAYRWQGDSEVKARIAFLNGQSVQARRDVKETVIRPITFTPNDVQLRLWEIAQNERSLGAAAVACTVLVDVMMMRAKCTEDLRSGKGWVDEERAYLAATELVPGRIAEITGCHTLDDLVKAKSLRGQK